MYLSQIGFTPALSKQELRALTVHYTAKEVRKGLEATMKKVEKHFTKEQNLFQVGALTAVQTHINTYTRSSHTSLCAVRAVCCTLLYYTYITVH